MLDDLQNAHNEIIRNQQFGVSILDIRIRKEEERKQMNDSYYNVKDYASRGLSWNIAFLDNILREESYVQNAVVWAINKSLQNGIDLNIRDESVDTKKVIGITDELTTKYMKPLLDFGVLGRGYGGSGALITINGNTSEDEMLTPLRYEDIKKDDRISIRPLTRLYQIIPDYSRTNRFISEVGKEFGIYDDTELGKPQYYRISISGGMYNKGDKKGMAGFNDFTNTFIVHRSRLLIYNDSKLSWIEEQVEQYFGIALSVRALDEIKRYKRALDEIMKMLNRSNIPVMNLGGLSNISRSGELGLQKIDDAISSYEYALEIGDLVVLGDKTEEELKFLQAEFRELSGILLDRKKELSAALQAPLSATFKEKDELDESDHYYAIQEIQERQYRPALYQLIPLIYKSKYGENIPDFSINFKSLETETEKGKVDKLKVATDMVTDLFMANIITVGEAKQMLTASSNNVGDMVYEINKSNMKENDYKLYKDFQIEISKELNWNNEKDKLDGGNKNYNMAEAKVKGRNEGGNNKATKKFGADVKIK